MGHKLAREETSEIIPVLQFQFEFTFEFALKNLDNEPANHRKPKGYP
jgi:hypothetical protein